MSAGIKANNDGSAAIQVGGTDYIEIASTGPVTIPGNLIVTGTATIGGQPVGGNYILSAYVAPATWTKGAGLKAIKVTVVGAGGAGGTKTANPAGSGSITGAAGGGGGGSAIEYIPAPSIPGPVAVTAGPGTNSFGAFCSATAGSAGGNATPLPGGFQAAGGTGGVGSGGNLNIRGQPGERCVDTAGPAGSGGSTILGGGGNGGGAAGGNYGGGGAGGYGPAPGTFPGGAGAPGVVIIEEFY